MAALGGAAEMRAEETLAGFLWRFWERLGGRATWPLWPGAVRHVQSRKA
jgi:hypothetical protein